MAAQQAEFVAFKAEVNASAAAVAASIAKLEEVVTKSNADATAAAAVIIELQKSYSSISLQAAPWSAAIQAEVAASEAKATGALAQVRALYEATKIEVEDLRRRGISLQGDVHVQTCKGASIFIAFIKFPWLRSWELWTHPHYNYSSQ